MSLTQKNIHWELLYKKDQMKGSLKISPLTLLVLMVAFNCCRDEEQPDKGWVIYEVSSDKKGFVVTYTDFDTHYKKEEEVDDFEWENSHTGYSGDPVYLSIRSKNDSAKITARINYQPDRTLEKETLKDSTARGDSVVVTLKDTLPDS